jgi:hypothetical protein
MRNKVTYLIIALALLTVVSCKKSTDTPATTTTTDYTSAFATQADDVDRFNEETNAMDDDANLALESSTSMGGRMESVIFDGTITYSSDTSNGVTRTLTITYSGTTFDGLRHRTGTLTISVPAGERWRDKGATITLTFDVTVTRILDNKTLSLKGTKTMTNVTGGLLKNLAPGDTMIHTITSPGGIALTFDDGTQRTWNLAKQRTFTYNSGINTSLTGTYSNGTNNNIAVWGTNRAGSIFTTYYSTPVVISQSCDFRVTSGVITHTGLAYSVTVTYGLDANGNPTSCPGAGHYYYKIAWTIGTQTYSKLVQY